MIKPKITPNSKYKQGIFKPLHPEKYAGDVSRLIFRSGLEKRYMMYFDQTPAITFWASEEIIVPYFSKIDGKMHKYFPDFIIRVKDVDNVERTFMVELKPFAQTQKPKGSKNKVRALQESITYEVNMAKWKAAAEFCDKHNMKFVVFTENTIKFK